MCVYTSIRASSWGLAVRRFDPSDGGGIEEKPSIPFTCDGAFIKLFKKGKIKELESTKETFTIAAYP
jgi:hypothetical protein